MSTNTTPAARKAPESGVLRFDGSIITYTSKHYGSFSVPLSEVAVIGEFTTDNGPFVDDWFLVFVPRSGSDWFEASMYAEDMESFSKLLSVALGSSIIVGLAASTDFASRIIWPVALAGHPLFSFGRATASGILRRITMRQAVSHRLSPDALSAIEQSASPETN